MSDEKKPNVTLLLHAEPDLKNPDGSWNKHAVMRRFFQSTHTEWAPFARSMGWKPENTIGQFPTRSWVKMKKEQLIGMRNDELRELSFNAAHIHRREILRTMRTYPMTGEKARKLLDIKFDAILRRYQREVEKSQNPKEGETSLEDPDGVINVDEIGKLTLTYNTLVQAHHKALLMDPKTYAIANQIPDDDEIDEEQSSRDWTMQVMGRDGKPMTSEELKELAAQYFDKPQSTPEELIEQQGDETEGENGATG